MYRQNRDSKKTLMKLNFPEIFLGIDKIETLKTLMKLNFPEIFLGINEYETLKKL